MRKEALLLLVVFSLSFAQYYQFYIVRASDHSTMNLVYDDYLAVGGEEYNGSFSYKDSSIENPDAQLRICALNAADLQDKWVSLAYADGTNPGGYIEITHYPVQITDVPPSLCAYVPLEISSFKAWYPSIPFLFIGNTTDLDSAERIKILPSRGWLVGNYTIASTQAGNQVTVDVTSAVDDNGAAIIPDVNFLVVGLMEDGTLVTTDTAITSIGDPVNLSLGAYTGPYYIHINGIGPGQFGPNVTIITPEPTTYASNNLPFTYTITSYYDLDSCWYVLDSQTVAMPDCTIPYILNVADGTHTLTLYANDTEGQVGSDSVTFRVETQGGGGGGGGGGGPHIPQPEVPPVIPPAYDYFSLNPEDIWITIDYPWAGNSNFFLYSKYALVDVYCSVKGDFAKYSTIELFSDEIQEGDTIDGTITVEIPPEILIDYKGSREGLIQCFGRSTVNSSLILSTSANVYLIINTPLVTVENITIENVTVGIYPGQILNETILMNNTGAGNSSTYALSVQFEGEHAKLISIQRLPGMIGHWQKGELYTVVNIPYDFPVGVYEVPLTVYENGKPIGNGHVTIKVKETYFLPEALCAFPLFLNYYAFYNSFPLWLFLILLGAANYALLNWRKRHTWQRRLLVAAFPILLALPGIWIFAPCFMMNVSAAQFILALLWKLFRDKEEEERYEGRKQRKFFRSETRAEEERDRKMAKEDEERQQEAKDKKE